MTPISSSWLMQNTLKAYLNSLKSYQAEEFNMFKNEWRGQLIFEYKKVYSFPDWRYKKFHLILGLGLIQSQTHRRSQTDYKFHFQTWQGQNLEINSSLLQRVNDRMFYLVE